MARRFYVPVLFLAVSIVLSGCAGGYERQTLAPPPPVTDRTNDHYASPAVMWQPDIPASALPARRHALGTTALPGGSLPTGAATALTAGCSLGDRFDNKETLAYDFAGGRSRVGLKLDMDGPSLSNPTRMQVNGVMFTFRRKLQPVQDKKAKCRYDSAWQGFAGSVYNEMVLREDKTIWHELEDRGVDFWR